MQRILVVEDEADIRDFLVDTLAAAGYQPQAAVDGADALRQVAASKPDLILLDMWLPKVTGWEFLRAYREGGLGQAPVIALTAAHPVGSAGERIEAHAVLAKPIEPVRLLEIVGQFLPPG